MSLQAGYEGTPLHIRLVAGRLLTVQDVFVHPGGQDDNLGDSALRAALLVALRRSSTRLHVHLDAQSSDYVAGLPLGDLDVLYEDRRAWLDASARSDGSAFVVNAGEINPQVRKSFPSAARATELRAVAARGGVVIAAGLGIKHPRVAEHVRFSRTLRDAAVVSWRDRESRDAADFGDVAPDWAFALGADPKNWLHPDKRHFLAVTLRFDRPWPDDRWFDEVRRLATRTTTRVITVAQVARDAPLAVRLADALNGEYLVAPSTRHDDMNAHVRGVYSRSLAVVSDRAHALIMGATEGAVPLGTAADPQKIQRILDAAGVGDLTGHHSTFADRASQVEAALPNLPGAVHSARQDLDRLTTRIHDSLASTP